MCGIHKVMDGFKVFNSRKQRQPADYDKDMALQRWLSVLMVVEYCNDARASLDISETENSMTALGRRRFSHGCMYKGTSLSYAEEDQVHHFRDQQTKRMLLPRLYKDACFASWFG
ncbi:hypothetical protein Csa_020424 [Cucumis sativus]|nr:hypothetical protein Csa_020424 [Cucumis sativus]